MPWWQWVLLTLAAIPTLALIFFVVFTAVCYLIAAIHLAYDRLSGRRKYL